MILVFFVYGLAFFSMGFAIALEARPPGGIKLARSLTYLAAFGILHSFVEWADMLLLIESASPPTFDMEVVRFGRTALLGASTAALVQFGAGLLAEPSGRKRWLKFLPGALVLAWIGAIGLLLTLYPLGSRQWLIHADVWARYLLYLPGSLLAGFGLVGQARELERTDLGQVARDARLAAVMFLLNALVAGLVVPPGQRFPADMLNSDVFLAIFGLPVQLVRAVSALATAYFILRVLRVFRIQRARQVELANERRIQAQQEALEVQKKAHEEIERWNRELEGRIQLRTTEITLRNRQLLAVNGIAVAISQSFDLHEILEETLRRTLDALDGQGGGIFLHGQVGAEPTTQLTQGLPEDFVKSVSKTRLDAVVMGRVDSPAEIEADTQAAADEEAKPGTEGLLFFLTAPLKVKGRVMGAMTVARSSEAGFTSEDGRLLTAIGYQVGIAVENARLFAQVQNMAALEERERLAREMHDGLAQVLGFLGIKTRVAQQLLSSGRSEQALSDLEQIQKTVQDAYAEVRQSILSLRTATELEKGLVAAIRDSAADFSEQNSVPVELALAEHGEVSFPPEAEVQLVRIVQEALANVRKHAKASKVWIRLERHDGEVLLSVEDDGIGFDPAQVAGKKRRCFGLETMRERAESVGASLEVIPVPGEGTRISVRYPVERRAVEPERTTQNTAG